MLWVSRCGLSDLDGIGVLGQLEELYASFNDISDMGALVGHDRLQILDLEGNGVSSLVDCRQLATCVTLSDLTLEACPIAGIPLYRRSIYKVLPRIECLDGVNFSDDDKEPLDPAVWKSVQAAASRLEIESGSGAQSAEAECSQRLDQHK